MSFDARWGIWKYRASFKQGNAAAKYLQIEVIPDNGSRMVIAYWSTGPDDYSGNETIKWHLRDSADNVIVLLAKDNTSVDNARMSLPSEDGSAETISQAIASMPGQVVIAGDDALVVETSQLAQNETLTLTIRAWLWGDIPTIDVSNSEAAGDVVTTTTYSTVI